MKLYFDDPGLDGQFQRTVSKESYKMANLGECLVIASSIDEHNLDSWYDAFFNFAQQLQQAAENGLAKGHDISAREKFLRACEYYRAAFFYHRENIRDEKLQTAYNAHKYAFQQYMKLSSLRLEPLDISFENGFFRGVFASPQIEKTRRPTIIHLGGYDGTLEELYPAILEGNSRGYNVYVMDGPGQGSCLYEQSMFMRPDWENLISPVINKLLERPDVDEKALCLIGRSFGGYTAVRAAAYEKRISALILDPGMTDIGDALQKRLPPDLADKIWDKSATTGEAFTALLATEKWRRLFLPRMATHGVKSVQDYLQIMMQYTNHGHIEKISCPTLVCDNVSDSVSTQQGKLVYDQLTCKKTFIQFGVEEGTEGHCQGLGQPVFFARIFDWLAENLKESGGC